MACKDDNRIELFVVNRYNSTINFVIVAPENLGKTPCCQRVPKTFVCVRVGLVVSNGNCLLSHQQNTVTTRQSGEILLWRTQMYFAQRGFMRNKVQCNSSKSQRACTHIYKVRRNTVIVTRACGIHVYYTHSCPARTIIDSTRGFFSPY